jgi:hypothetical protein
MDTKECRDRMQKCRDMHSRGDKTGEFVLVADRSMNDVA